MDDLKKELDRIITVYKDNEHDLLVELLKLIQSDRQRLIQKIKKAVEESGDLSQFGSGSGSMMKGSMLKYLDSLDLPEGEIK